MEKQNYPEKTCYNHIGGKLGTLLMEEFIKKEWITKSRATDKQFYITPLGEKEFAKLGIDLLEIQQETM